MLSLQAPAKINLTLEVLSRRSDDFHEIRSVMQTVSLSDTFSFRSDGKIEVGCDDPRWDPERSLVMRAIELLQRETRCTKGAKIEIIKRIPMSSGLGGDSSDAAAVLVGLSSLWGLNLELEDLTILAARLGSDVPFFLYGGTALAEGRGEIVTPLPQFPRMKVVLLVPPLPRLEKKTAQLYQRLERSHYTGGELTDRLLAVLKQNGEIKPAMLYNAFEQVAFDSFSGLGKYWQMFSEAGASGVHLAGSGPALFTLTRDKFQAGLVYKSLLGEGLEAYLADTASPWALSSAA